MSGRPSTPDPVARVLRQESGFGCCVCGKPIIQYHHIVDWSVEQHFRADDMMTLCLEHHDQATKKVLSEDEQRAAKAEPFNIRRGRPQGLLAVKQDYAAVAFGSVDVVGEGPFVKIDGVSVLGLHIDSGQLEISLTIQDNTGAVILKIERNVWTAGDPTPWDIECDWQRLKVRRKLGDVALDLRAGRRPMEVRLKTSWGDSHLDLAPSGITCTGGLLTVKIADLALVGMAIEFDTPNKTLALAPGVGGGSVVSWPDRRVRLEEAKHAWQKLKAQRIAP